MSHKRTKIVCTIGPASSSDETLRAIISAGMNVARLNFSHGTHDEHADLIRRIRAISEDLGEPIAILQDLQGPKIRVGVLPDAGVTLVTGQRVTFTTGEADVKAMKLPVTYERLQDDVKPGERILLDDGLLSAKVVSVEGRDVICEVVDGGILTSHKGVNFPESRLSVSAITEKDRDDLKFGVAEGVDFVALSFVRTAQEIHDLRALITLYEEESGSESKVPIRIIAKIEKNEGVRNIKEILEAVDSIMVARGDLGIETRPETVPMVQKRLIDACLEAAKPVIVATQMLDSMIRNPRPTRAEVADIAAAVMEHADAVMLSGETASGKYPVEAVKMMASVILETEESVYDDLDVADAKAGMSPEDAISKIANILAHSVETKLILVGSPTGEAARVVSRYRPERPIFAASADARVRRQLNLSWGVAPFPAPEHAGVEEFIAASMDVLKKNGDLETGDRVVVVAEEPDGGTDGINVVEIRDVA